jgi:hypothetical protein
MQQDWFGLVGVPFLVAVVSIGWIYARNPRNRDLLDTRRFMWSALAGGVVWALIRSFAQYRDTGGVSWEPLVGGLVLFAATLLVRWILLLVAAR